MDIEILFAIFRNAIINPQSNTEKMKLTYDYNFTRAFMLFTTCLLLLVSQFFLLSWFIVRYGVKMLNMASILLCCLEAVFQ